jgi:drug/metabolite transporter (DMT)-like permease
MKYVFVSGAIMVFPFGFNDFTQIHWNDFTSTIWAATFFVVIGTTFFAYLFNTLALRSLSPGVVSVYIYLQPVMAAGFAMLLGKDQPSIVHLIAAIFIFAGVYLTTASGVKGKGREMC